MDMRGSEILEYLKERHPVVKYLRSFENPGGHKDDEHMHLGLHQIIFYTSGAGVNRIFNATYPIVPGAFYIAGPKELHSAASESGAPLTGITCRFELPGFQGKLLPSVVKPSRLLAPEAEMLFKKALAEVTLGGAANMIKASFLLSELLILLSGEDGKAEEPQQEPLSKLVEEGVAFMNASFKEEIGIEEVAARCGVTASHFCRTFKKEMGGLAPLAYLRKLRLGFALERLFSSKERISEIAANSGFKSAKNLNMAFQQAYDMSPQEFRRRRFEGLQPGAPMHALPPLPDGKS